MVTVVQLFILLKANTYVDINSNLEWCPDNLAQRTSEGTSPQHFVWQGLYDSPSNYSLVKQDNVLT